MTAATTMWCHPRPPRPADSVVVGTSIADLLIENLLVIELKAVISLDAIHTAQCLNYLKATRF